MGTQAHSTVRPSGARRYDAILIDFYGTISAGDREAVEAACVHVVEVLGLPIGAAEFAVAWGKRFFGLIDRSNHDAFRTLHEIEIQSLDETLQTFGCRADPKPFVAILEEYWANPPAYADGLAFLRQVDRPVCCVSNADTQPLLQAIQKHGLRFDAVVTSEDARCYKPDPGIFHRALEALGTTPDRALHIGDSLHSDIGGARAIGITSVWVRRASRIHDIGTCRPDYTIASLDGIVADVPL